MVLVANWIKGITVEIGGGRRAGISGNGDGDYSAGCGVAGSGAHSGFLFRIGKMVTAAYGI